MNQLQLKQKKQDSLRNPQHHTGQSPGFSKAADHPYLQAQGIIGNHGILRRHRDNIIQAKLKIGQPNDKYEQEADRMADQVMCMPEPRIQRKPTCPECMEEDEQEILRPKQTNNQTPTVTSNIESGINSLRGSGEPLPESARSFFEPRFGHDFSDVRVHADSMGAVAADSVNAKAFTMGKNVVFGAGQFQPATTEGRRLLAHELTHVVQQNRGQALFQRQNNLMAHELTHVIQQSPEIPSSVHRKIKNGPVIHFLEREADRMTDKAAKVSEDSPRVSGKAFPLSLTPVTGHVPRLQLKGIDKTIPEDVDKGMFGSFELFFEEEAQQGQGGLDGYIMFTPSKSPRVPDSSKIGLVQIASSVDDEAGVIYDVTHKYPELKLPKALVTTEDKKRGIEPGFFVDVVYRGREEGEPFSKFYIDRPEGGLPGYRYYNIPTKKGTFVDKHGYKKGSKVEPAILTDAPKWNRESTFSFETYAQSDSQTYGGVRWGFKIKTDPDVKHFNKRVSDGVIPPVIEPTTVGPIFNLTPTAREAIKQFEQAFPPVEETERPAEETKRNTLGAVALFSPTSISPIGGEARYTRVFFEKGRGRQDLIGVSLTYLREGDEIDLGVGYSVRYSWPKLYVQGGVRVSGAAQFTPPEGEESPALRLDIVPNFDAGVRMGVVRVGAGYQLLIPVKATTDETELEHAVRLGISVDL